MSDEKTPVPPLTSDDLFSLLVVGTKIRLGKEYCAGNGYTPGEVLTLIEGTFDEENGMWTETVTAPSVWCDVQEDFDSIQHLFGNNLEDFADCEIIQENAESSHRTK